MRKLLEGDENVFFLTCGVFRGGKTLEMSKGLLSRDLEEMIRTLKSIDLILRNSVGFAKSLDLFEKRGDFDLQTDDLMLLLDIGIKTESKGEKADQEARDTEAS